MPDSGFFASIVIDNGTELNAYNSSYFGTLVVEDETELPKFSSGYPATLSVFSGQYLPVYSSGFMATVPIRETTMSNDLTFTYVLTSITDIIPDPAPYPGGVTIMGTMLDKATAVYMDNKRASYRIISETEIHAMIPYNVSSLTIDVYVEFDY